MASSQAFSIGTLRVITAASCPSARNQVASALAPTSRNRVASVTPVHSVVAVMPQTSSGLVSGPAPVG